MQPLKSGSDKGANKILSVDSGMCHNANHFCILSIHYVSEVFETPILYLVDMCKKRSHTKKIKGKLQTCHKEQWEDTLFHPCMTDLILYFPL